MGPNGSLSGESLSNPLLPSKFLICKTVKIKYRDAVLSCIDLMKYFADLDKSYKVFVAGNGHISFPVFDPTEKKLLKQAENAGSFVY